LDNGEFKKCTHCGRLVLSNATTCRHCGAALEATKKTSVKKPKASTPELIVYKICFFIVVIAIVLSFLGDVTFQLTHLFPKPSQTNLEPVNPHTEMQQDNLQPPKQINYKTGNEFRILILQAKYSLSGIVVAKNNNFWLRVVMQNDFDKVVPFDFGIVWGDIADKKLLEKHFKFKSFKTLGQARMLSYKWRSNVPYSADYILSHISHNHIIPANDNITSALFKIKKWNNVKFDGYLVDIIYPSGVTSYTSLSRSDTNPQSRGGGACEIFYVTGVQIGDKYYE